MCSPSSGFYQCGHWARPLRGIPLMRRRSGHGGPFLTHLGDWEGLLFAVLRVESCPYVGDLRRANGRVNRAKIVRTAIRSQASLIARTSASFSTRGVNAAVIVGSIG